MTGLLRILFLLFIVMAVLSFVRSIVASPKAGGERAPGPDNPGSARATRTGKLFKDPVCGTYVTSEGSPTAVHDGESVYFCSDDCRTRFLSSEE